MANGKELLEGEVVDLVAAADFIPDQDKAFIDEVALKLEGRLFITPPETWRVHKLWDNHCDPAAKKGSQS